MKAFAAILPLALLAGCGGNGVTDLIPNLVTATGNAAYEGPTTFVPVTATPIGSPVRGYVFRNSDNSQALTVEFDAALQNGSYEAGDSRFALVEFSYGTVNSTFESGTIRVESGRVVLSNATFLFVAAGETPRATFNGSASRSLPPAL